MVMHIVGKGLRMVNQLNNYKYAPMMVRRERKKSRYLKVDVVEAYS